MSNSPQQGTVTLTVNTEQQSMSHTHKLNHTIRRQHTYCTLHLYLTGWDPDVYFSSERFLMVTFAAQWSKQFNNVTPSMSSNHEAGFSLPSCAHTTGRKSELLHPPWRQRGRCTSIIHGICGYVEWTGRSKLGTFCSDAIQSPRGANYHVSFRAGPK